MSNSNNYTSIHKNYAVCKKELDSISNCDFICEKEEIESMKFFKINGIANFWKTESDLSTHALIGDILNSVASDGVTFAYVIVGDKKGINVYIGTSGNLMDGLKSSYESAFPGVDITPVEGNYNPLKDCSVAHGGMFTGIPTNKFDKEKKNLQIENICRGMQGENFTYVVLASGIASKTIFSEHERILEEMGNAFSLISRSIVGGPQGNLNMQVQNFHNKNYYENLVLLENMLKEGVSRGMWRVNGYFASDNEHNARRLSSIIKASYSGEDSKPEPFRVIDCRQIKDVIPGAYMIYDLIGRPELHPLESLFQYKYQTILNSDQLATICQLPTKEFPGYYVDQYVEFDVSNRTKETSEKSISIGDICIAGQNGKLTNNEYTLRKDDLTRHALIIGITGGGKTNTAKSVLQKLWCGNEKVPFMVIESAKREYWELRNIRGFDELIVFTLGAETAQGSVSYRINPFETIPQISLQTHIDYLLSTFKAAFDLQPPLPYILEKSVYEIYADRGWDIVENKNLFGLKEYPTLTDLYNKIAFIVDNMGYHNEVQSNVKTALQARINSLMIGGKGAMLNTPKSVPIDKLLDLPVVMELEDLGDDETKAFVIGLLLVQLYEYRKSQMTSGSKELSHILMVEEAHRLLKNVSGVGEGNNSRAKSVEFFCNLLAEIRTFGQGIIISDQIPTKLASDTIKNTNLKIVHRTVAMEDRETIGQAMNMTPEQIEHLSSLKRGYAAVYAEGDNRPKCVKLPLVEYNYKKTREAVIEESKASVNNIIKDYDKVIQHHVGCLYCEHRCKYYDEIYKHFYRHIDVQKVVKKLESTKCSPIALDNLLNSKMMQDVKLDNDFKRICALGYILNKKTDLNDGQRQKYLSNYLKYKKQI